MNSSTRYAYAPIAALPGMLKCQGGFTGSYRGDRPRSFDADGDPIEAYGAAPREPLGRYEGEGERGLRYAESCDGRGDC